MKAYSGRVHSIQSLGAVDGPGLRCVVFLQGCPLRCVYCHNPDTWAQEAGTIYDIPTLVKKLLRYRPYFGTDGGVTLSGGEPLLQEEFSAKLFAVLQAEGIHTALDTSGIGSGDLILPHTDLLLLDLKFSSNDSYRTHCGGTLSSVLHFLDKAARHSVPVWLRHVVVPGLTDTAADMNMLYDLQRKYINIEKIELLPFRKLCVAKYAALQLPFPLLQTPEASNELIETLYQTLEQKK